MIAQVENFNCLGAMIYYGLNNQIDVKVAITGGKDAFWKHEKRMLKKLQGSR